MLAAQVFGMHHREMDAEGIVHVDARPEVGRGIRTVQGAHQLPAEAAVIEDERAQVVSVGPQGGDQQKSGHARGQERVQLLEVAAVRDQEVHCAEKDIPEPEVVRNDKIFVERNEIVHPYMDQVVQLDLAPLEVGEPGKIEDQVEQDRHGMPQQRGKFREGPKLREDPLLQGRFRYAVVGGRS